MDHTKGRNHSPGERAVIFSQQSRQLQRLFHLKNLLSQQILECIVLPGEGPVVIAQQGAQALFHLKDLLSQQTLECIVSPGEGPVVIAQQGAQSLFHDVTAPFCLRL